MALLLPYKDTSPQISPHCFLVENATLIGKVTVSDRASVWFSTVIRADVNYILIGEESNIQDACVLHVNGSPSHPTVIGKCVTVGHGVMLHGCEIRDGAMIGISSTILNGAVIGESALVAAGSLVREGQEVPPRTLVAGVPARIIRPLTEEEIEKLSTSAPHYWNDIASEYIRQQKAMRQS